MERATRVCHDRCPADYGKSELLEMIEARIDNNPEVELVKSGCLRICQKLGGTDKRPPNGIANFEEVVNGIPTAQGAFMIDDQNKITKVYLQ